jgi:hypothetical protein
MFRINNQYVLLNFPGFAVVELPNDAAPGVVWMEPVLQPPPAVVPLSR